MTTSRPGTPDNAHISTRRSKPWRLVAGAVAVALTGFAAPVPSAVAADPATDVEISYTFEATGSPQYWIVPGNVTAAEIEVSGGSGGGSPLASGGLGGRASATFALTPGSTLQVNVGGAGGQGSAGWNGGGSPGLGYSASHIGGGGGASDIRTGDYGLNDRIIVAGGAGGAGFAAGGAGGGLTGTGGAAYNSSSPGGGGATQTAGGHGPASPCGGYGGQTGSFGSGGYGNNYAGGGAGGGGWYGGGSAPEGCGIGGGGGGSGYISTTATSPSMSTGVNAGDGTVTISYSGSVLPTTTVTSSATPTLLGAVTYTATLSGLPTSPVLTSAGTITFSDAGTPIPTCTDVAVSSWTATCTLDYSDPGVHTIAAAYSGDVGQGVDPSSSSPITQQVYTSKKVFDFAGAVQTWTVPAGVTAGFFQAYGARGGAANGFYLGELGGEAEGLVAVQPGSDVQVNVGGTTGTPGGWNGGGAGGYCGGCGGGGGGGGASDVRTGDYGLADRLVVGGGGGGGGSVGRPGAGGGTTGGNGTGGNTAGFGSGGSQTAGGAGGTTLGGCFPVLNGAPGTFGNGGAANRATDAGLGGGGGGGWYGGGAGGECGYDGGGGGGGSGYVVPTATHASLTSKVQDGNGRVVVWYDLVPQPTTMSVSCAPASTVATGDPTVCTATVSNVDPLSPTATGTIDSWSSDGAGTFYEHGTTTPATSCTLDAASCALDYVPALGSAASQSITAAYAGDPAHQASDADSDPFLLTVAKPTVTVTAGDQSIVYGTDDPTFSYAVSGPVEADDLTTSPDCGVAGDHRDVGTYPIVCSGADAGDDYAVDFIAGTLTVTQADIVITPDSASIVYGDADPDFTYAVTGPVGDDDLTTDPTCDVNGDHTDAGTYPITCTGADAGDNYTITYGPGTLTVAKAAGVITPDPQTITYGSPEPTFGYTVSGLEPDDDLTTDPTCGVTGNHTDAGTYEITCTGGDAGDNYTLSRHTAELTVNPADVLITADNQTHTYGDDDDPFTATTDGLLGDDDLTTDPTCGVTGDHTDAGTYPITCTGADAGDNYTITYGPGTLTVAKAVLTVTAEDVALPFGSPVPTLTATASGFVNDDAQGVGDHHAYAGSPSLTTTATSDSDLGTYPISVTVGTLTSDNYTFSFVPGTLTVGVADQAIDITSDLPTAPVVGDTAELAATGGGSGQDVTFAADPSTPGCTVSGTTVSFLHAGDCVVHADQAGSDQYSPAPTVTSSVTVGRAAQSIAITSTAPSAAVPDDTYVVSVGGGGSSAAPVLSIDPSTAAVCSISGDTVRFLHNGVCTVNADQAGDDDYTSAPTATQSITVGRIDQLITFISTAPIDAVVGATYSVSATGGGSGSEVTYAVDAATTNEACRVTGTMVTFAHPGSCVLRAAQAGGGDYAAGAATQQVSVAQAATTTTVVVRPTSISADVAVTAPGAGEPTGTVTFAVGGEIVGSAPVVGGTATLDYTVPSGAVRAVSAVYSGDADLTGSSATTARLDPSITASVRSASEPSEDGWYRTPVTVSFECGANGATLTAPCPEPVTLTRDGAGLSVTRTITATDGGAATVVVGGINLDRTKPSVRVTGIADDAVYDGTAPVATCVGRDALSGVDTCTIEVHRKGDVTRYVATATDRAGNSRSVSGKYRTLSIYVADAPYAAGAFKLQAGQTYTVVAHSTRRPRYADPAVFPGAPTPSSTRFRAAGEDRWAYSVKITRAMSANRFWNLGVQIGQTMHRVKIRVE